MNSIEELLRGAAQSGGVNPEFFSLSFLETYLRDDTVICGWMIAGLKIFEEYRKVMKK